MLAASLLTAQPCLFPCMSINLAAPRPCVELVVPAAAETPAAGCWRTCEQTAAARGGVATPKPERGHYGYGGRSPGPRRALSAARSLSPHRWPHFNKNLPLKCMTPSRGGIITSDGRAPSWLSISHARSSKGRNLDGGEEEAAEDQGGDEDAEDVRDGDVSFTLGHIKVLYARMDVTRRKSHRPREGLHRSSA